MQSLSGETGNVIAMDKLVTNIRTIVMMSGSMRVSGNQNKCYI